MYNAEEFIAECLDSILMQTFQDFEVIVADDCSTDNSVKIVESYLEKFGGRLKITHTEKNSGGGGYVPRNLGLSLARGEYVWFVDADDFILLTALEILYNAAKEYDADVVYTSAHYQLNKPNDLIVLRDGKGRQLLSEGSEDTPVLNEEADKNLQMLIFDRGFTTPWSKLIRRDFLLENKILFPEIAKAADHIWSIGLYCQAKRVMRLPTPLYFYRKYNANSVSRTKRPADKQVSFWVASFVEWLKTLQALANRIEILRKNPAYCYEASKRDFAWLLNNLTEEMNASANQKIYEILYREFNKRDDLSDVTIPFLFSTIDADRKERKEDLQTILHLKKEADRFKKISTLSRSSSCPIISIIIPLYNAENFIGECIESILNQTFQDFEVIVVDDCSTDNSVEVVRSYIPKFDGRLKILSMEKNSGSAPAPRNKGFLLSRGEYIFFMDSDDTFTKTALEEMYTLAKEYDADVVYCEKYYMSTGVGEEFIKNIHLANEKIQMPPFVKKPTLISDDLAERLEELSKTRFWVTPWQRLVSRKVLAENKITFPEIIGSDDVVWCFQVLCCAKRFLRVPNICYIRRMYDESFTKSKKSPNRTIHQWADIAVRGLKFIDNFTSKLKFFQDNPAYRYHALKTVVTRPLKAIDRVCEKLSPEELYDIFLKEFAKDTGENDVLTSFLFVNYYKDKKLYDTAQMPRKFMPHLTARIDIKLMTTEGEFQILSVSDKSADVLKPDWMQQDGTGYQIQSYAGQLKFVAKAEVDGQIQLRLRGLDIHDTENSSKRIPYWIDYTKLTINGQIILDKLTPAWHDKSYLYKVNAKSGEEIKIQVEWLPHRSDT